ncbi:MAG: thiol reductase thioredoxin [Bacilli bacterium]|nr:thiol reductase thioredoxin [Bacilli bacterium]
MIKYLENESDFKEIIKEGTWIVDFYADWCGPCKMLGAILEETDYNILKVNTDSFQDLSFSFGIMSIPTLIIFKDGKEKNKSIGLIDREELKRIMDFE